METVIREGSEKCEHVYVHYCYDDGDEYIECIYCERSKIKEGECH